MKSVKNPIFSGSDAHATEQRPQTRTDNQNILFFSFGLRALFCAGVFVKQKYEFSGLNSSFSVRAFMDTARDALTDPSSSTAVQESVCWPWKRVSPLIRFDLISQTKHGCPLQLS
jgi:hypothetical protein